MESKMAELKKYMRDVNSFEKLCVWGVFENGYETFFYGCGNQGLICEDLLVNSLGFSVSGYVVSDGQPLSVRWSTELPVYPISRLLCKKEKVNIILTMGYNLSCSVKEMLVQAGYKNICLIEDWEEVNDELRELALMAALDKVGYHYSKQDKFVIGNFRFINPYKDKLTRVMFMRECENIIGERYLNEKNKPRIDSSYEMGDVKLDSDDVVLDCGANIGLFSAFAASLGCKVLSFEPVTHIVSILSQVAELYPEKIFVVQSALSDEEGKVFFMQADKEDCFHQDSSAIVDGRGENTIEIPSTTVDAVVEQYKLDRVDFIKADIEGAERRMLKGAKETLRRYAPKLSICTYHLPDDKEVLTNIILEANPEYTIEYRWDKLYAYVPD